MQPSPAQLRYGLCPSVVLPGAKFPATDTVHRAVCGVDAAAGGDGNRILIRRKRIIASLRTARTSRPQRRSRHMLAVALLAVASTFAATATAFEDYTDVSSPPLPTSSIYTAGPPSFFFFSSMYVCVCACICAPF